MRIIKQYLNLSSSCRGAAVALGNFDGIHIGHQKVVSEIKKIAEHLETMALLLCVSVLCAVYIWTQFASISNQ